jgi:hypothetical protein
MPSIFWNLWNYFSKENSMEWVHGVGGLGPRTRLIAHATMNH